MNHMRQWAPPAGQSRATAAPQAACCRQQIWPIFTGAPPSPGLQTGGASDETVPYHDHQRRLAGNVRAALAGRAGPKAEFR